MSDQRLQDYLEHIQQAANKACGFTQGMSEKEFMSNDLVQMATVMELVAIGEASAKLIQKYPEFAQNHPEIKWHNMRGMRNRIIHGYFNINFNKVWEVTQEWLPELLEKLSRFQNVPGYAENYNNMRPRP